MSNAGLFAWQEKLGKTNPNCLTLVFQITAAKTVSAVPQGTPVLTAFDAIASQSTIDDFLGTTNEFLVAAFDATSMGNDAFACIVDMKGQVAKLLYATAECFSGAVGAEAYVMRESLNTGLTASTLETAASLGANGNLALKVAFGNTPDFDALTSGTIVLKLYWVSK
jgi:hypothetical protein